MTDENLVQAACKGNEAAFRCLYESYRDPLFRFAYRLTGSVELAEDIVHDCFVSLIRGGFAAERGPLRGYLFATVRNLARKHFRDTGREETTGSFEMTPADETGPLTALIARETTLSVQAAVAALPFLQREVLVMFAYEQLPLSVIAAVVDADLAAVKSRLHRARERLKRTLGAPVSPGGTSI
jgi:RNA polymerase sigma-70 factor (ECF subfamily)